MRAWISEQTDIRVEINVGADFWKIEEMKKIVDSGDVLIGKLFETSTLVEGFSFAIVRSCASTTSLSAS